MLTRLEVVALVLALLVALAVGMLTAPGAAFAWCWGGCS